MSMLCAALVLVLGPVAGDRPIGPTSSDGPVRVDWSSAAGADSAIAGVRRDYVTAINARDARAEAFYATDAVAALTSGSIVNGAPALTGQLRTALESDLHPITITLTPRRFLVDGATGSETGTFVETVADGDHRRTVEGVYVTIYSRSADGQWRIAMEVRSTGATKPLAVW